jgi:hypothetical protein
MFHCFRCGKKTSTKSNLNSHLKNKKKCGIKYMYISRKTIINDYDKYLNEYLSVMAKPSITHSITKIDNIKNIVSHNDTQTNKIVSQYNSLTIPQLLPADNKTDDILCEFCGKNFAHKNNYYRHKKFYCYKSEQHQIMDEYLQTKYDLLKMEYEEKLSAEKEKTDKIEEKLREQIENEQKLKEDVNKLKIDLENKIKDLESKLVPSVSNTQINNGHIGDNITNITINNYGEEKFNITAQDCENIMSHEFNMIVKLIEHIHINQPENRNAFIPSLKEKYAMVMKDQKWNLVDRKEFISNLVITKNVMLEQLLDDYGSQFVSVNPNRSRSIINYCKNDEEEYNKIKINTNLLLYNNKDLVKNTYESNYNKRIKGR